MNEQTDKRPVVVISSTARDLPEHRNVLAEVERDEGNVEKAAEAAERACRLAWRDGPPFAYHWALERARGLLRESGAGEPSMPAFDAS